MATFKIGVAVESKELSIQVDGELKPGLHRFQLEVVNDRGQRSAATVVTVRVEDAPPPPATAQRK